MKARSIRLLTIVCILSCIMIAIMPALSCSTTTVLVIKKGHIEKSLSLAEIKALPATEGTMYWMSHTGEIHGPYNVKGVTLEILCDQVGGIDAGEEAMVTATDGWASTFKYEQMQTCDFKAYDRTTGDKIISDDLTVVIAYEVNGAPIDPTTEGPLWTVIICPPDQAVYGAYFVKWTNLIEISNSATQWSISLKGIIEEEMTHTAFIQKASPNKHGISWTDEEGNLWEGVPLWWLVARVDDDIEGSECELNQKLADSGYNVYIEARDNYSKTMSIADISQHDDWVVAYKCNGMLINQTDHSWPLKLVGPGLIDAFRIGGIVKIRLLLP